MAYLPLVRWLKARKIPRALSSIVLVFILLVIPIALFTLLGTAIIDEGKELSADIPDIIKTIEQRFDIELGTEVQERLNDNGGLIVGSVATLTSSLFKIVVGFVILLIISIYWLTYYEPVRQGAIDLFAKSKNEKTYLSESLTAVEARLGQWVKAQILISTVVGISTWIILLILGVPYAGVLAMIAAILELVPTLGPILSAVPAIAVALTVDLRLAVTVTIAYIVIQQVESYLITPRLLGKVVGLNPFVVLLVVLIGTQLLGLIGALIAVPFTITAQEIVIASRKRPAVTK